MRFALPFPVVVASILAGSTAFAQTLIHVPPFNSIELEGGGHVVVKYGQEQQVRLLSGSTAFTRIEVEEGNKLRIEACNDQCPHRYNLDVEITTPRIDALAISGGGRIEAADGFPPPNKLTLAVDGGGTIDSRSLRVARATAAIEGGGVIKLSAAEKLTAAINGGGKIQYWGEPKLTEAVEGGGDVERGE